MLFGSLAWRDPTPQSHIDLMAIYDNVTTANAGNGNGNWPPWLFAGWRQRRTLPL